MNWGNALRLFLLLLLLSNLGLLRALSNVNDLSQGSSQKRWQAGKKVPDISQDEAFVAAANKVVQAIDSLLPSSKAQQQAAGKQKHRAEEVKHTLKPLKEGPGCGENSRESKQSHAQGAPGTDASTGNGGQDFIKRFGRVLSSNPRSRQEEGKYEDVSGGWKGLFGGIGRRARSLRDPSFDELVSGRIPPRPTSLLELLAGSTGGSTPTPPLLPGAAELLRSPASPEAVETLEILASTSDLTASIFYTLHNAFEIVEYSLGTLHSGAFLFLDPALWFTQLQQAINEGFSPAERQKRLGETWSSLLSLMAERLEIVSSERENAQKMMEQLDSSGSLLRRTFERFLPKEGERFSDSNEQLRDLVRGDSEEGYSSASEASKSKDDATLEEELSRSEEDGVERLVEDLRSGLEEASSMLREAASSVGEEALKQGAELALESLEEVLSLYVELAMEVVKEAGKEVVKRAAELGEEARGLAEEVQREALKEIAKEVVEVLRDGVEEVKKAAEEGEELGREAGMEVSKEVAERVMELLKNVAKQVEAVKDGADSIEETVHEAFKTVAEQLEGSREEAIMFFEEVGEAAKRAAEEEGDKREEDLERSEEEGREAAEKAEDEGKSAEKEGASLAEEVSREVARRAEEAFQREFEEALERTSKGGAEEAEHAEEEYAKLLEEVRKEAANAVAEWMQELGEEGISRAENARREAAKRAAEKERGTGEEDLKPAKEEASEAANSAVEKGKEAGEEGAALPEEVSREVARRAEEAFQRRFQKAVKASKAGLEETNQKQEEEVSAGIDEAVKLMQQVLQRGLEETIAAGGQAAKERNLGASNKTNQDLGTKVLRAASEAANYFPGKGKDVKRLGEALADGLAKWSKQYRADKIWVK